MTHYLLIQSAHSDSALSAARLAISRVTAIPALASQTRKPVLVLHVHEDDPLLSDRVKAFQSTGCEVRLHRSIGEFSLYGNKYSLPVGRKVISRIDDDDSICKEFCSTVYAAAHRQGEYCLRWDTGYVYWRNEIYLLTHKRNQFVSLVTNTNSTPHDKPHVWYPDNMPSFNVSNKPGWVWVRHGIAMSSTRAKYRPKKVGRIQSERFDLNLRAVSRVTSVLGLASESYTQHRQLMRERRIHYEDMVSFGQATPREKKQQVTE